MKLFEKVIWVVGITSVVTAPCWSRRVREPVWKQFLRSKDETINYIVEEIMHSSRGKKLIQDIKKALEDNLREGSFPLRVKEIIVPAGYGYEYKVDICFSQKDKYGRSFISVTIYGDTEPEDFSEDPSCWDRTKVIMRCVIRALESLGMNIIREKADCEDPYWYNYYLLSESN